MRRLFLALSAAALALSAGTARAEELRNPRPETTVERRAVKPNRLLLVTGSLALLAGWIPAAVVGASSDRKEDKYLWAPVAGPWIDLASRSSCQEPNAPACDNERIYRGMLIATGVVHAAGLAQIIAAFFVPEHTDVTIAPMRFANGGGAAVTGTF